ncbi:MAG: CerR family C-terminal domain-containing protein [Alphaproteobacteria bacterium]|nr:CerR family C-terminal domain-containing protein [Alphaproteobacteria bacterium]
MKETKEKLLSAAAELFAQKGMDGVSTRDLVKRAKVNLCSINYYFGTKQKLYDAVLDNMTDKISSFLKTHALPTDLSAGQELCLIISNMIDLLCSLDLSETQAQLFIKELISPSAPYNRLYEKVIEPLHKRISALISELTGLPETGAIIQAHCLLGQIVMFKIHKEALLRRLRIKQYSPELIFKIKKQILKNCEALLNGALS